MSDPQEFTVTLEVTTDPEMVVETTSPAEAARRAVEDYRKGFATDTDGHVLVEVTRVRWGTHEINLASRVGHVIGADPVRMYRAWTVFGGPVVAEGTDVFDVIAQVASQLDGERAA